MLSAIIIQFLLLQLFFLKALGKPTSMADIAVGGDSPKLQACGTDLRRLLDWLCTYPNEKLPCYSHFMDESGHNGSKTTKKENPLLLIEKMKKDALAADDYEEYLESGKTTKNLNRTLIETCCFEGCAISQIKERYCCFSQDCLELCYPGEFEIFRR